MATKFKKGDRVVQVVQEPFAGRVERFVFDESSGEISYVVRVVDPDGTIHERVFDEAGIKASE